MSIAALITGGIGPGGSILYVLTEGLDIGAAGIVTVPAARKHGAALSRLYAYPFAKRRKREDEDEETPSVEIVRELYKEARRAVPESLQAGLLPLAFQVGSKRVTSLPPVRNVDFEKLAGDLQAVNVLFAALEAARQDEARLQAAQVERLAQERKKHLRDEEAFLMILMQL